MVIRALKTELAGKGLCKCSVVSIKGELFAPGNKLVDGKVDFAYENKKLDLFLSRKEGQLASSAVSPLLLSHYDGTTPGPPGW